MKKRIKSTVEIVRKKKKGKKGVSPVIGAVFIFSILFSTFAVFIVWQANMERMELQREKERQQQEAMRKGESLLFFDYQDWSTLNRGNIGIINNGATPLEIVHIKVDNTYIDEASLQICDENGVHITGPNANVIHPGQFLYIHVHDGDDWSTITVGTALGNQFVYNKPTAIFLKYEPTGGDITFYGDAAAVGSTIVDWQWDFAPLGLTEHGQNPQTTLPYNTGIWVTLTVTDALGISDTTPQILINIPEQDVVGQVTPIVALENVGNTGSTYGRWWIFRFRKGCDQVSIPLQNISGNLITLTDMKVFWHELQQSDPCVSDLCPARLASARIYRQYKPGGEWNGEWILARSVEPTTWNPNFDPDPSTPEEENFPGGIALLGKYRFMDPEDLWRECFWGFYETQDCNCLDCEGGSPDYIGFNISGELLSFVDPDDPNTPEYLDFGPDEIIVVTLRFCAGNRCGDDLTLKLYDPEEVYTITVHVPLDVQVGPRDGSIESSSTVTFRWRELFDYESWFLFGGCVHDEDFHYWLQISTDPEFPEGNRLDIIGGDIFNYDEIAIVKYTLTLSPDERYYWRVNGSKDQGNTWSGWSRPWVFCVGSCPSELSTFITREPAALQLKLLRIMVLPLLLWISSRRKRLVK